jgi:hypothetical protein
MTRELMTLGDSQSLGVQRAEKNTSCWDGEQLVIDYE